MTRLGAIALASMLGAAACGAPAAVGEGAAPPEGRPPAARPEAAASDGAKSEKAGAAGDAAAPAGETAAPKAENAATAAPDAQSGERRGGESARPALASAPAPKPLTKDEQKTLETTCRPLVDAVMEIVRKTGKGSELAALRTIAENPPKMPIANLPECVALFERALRGYLQAAVEVEATTVTRRMALGMASAFAESGTLCPSTERPVPARLENVLSGPYRSTSADWQTPTWKCLQIDLTDQTQRFQYEVRTDAAAKSFEIVARGSPGQDDRVVELVQRGTIKDGNLELGPPERR